MVRAAVVIPASQAALGGRLWFYTASGSGRGTLNVYDMAQGSCLVCCGPAVKPSCISSAFALPAWLHVPIS